MVMAEQLCEYTQKYQLYTLKLNFMVCEFYQLKIKKRKTNSSPYHIFSIQHGAWHLKNINK